MRRIRKQGEPLHFKEWKQDFLASNGRVPVYRDLYQTEEYKRLKEDLIQEQGFICCYCEQEIGRPWEWDCDIEHFMPRHPDKKLLTEAEQKICRDAQLDYNNLFISCLGAKQFSLDHCNHKKDNWYDFRYCVSPASEEIRGLFGFRLNGKVFAVDSNPQGEEMRRHLNLDTYVLQEQRKKALDAVLETEFGDEDLLTDDYILATAESYGDYKDPGKYIPFVSMVTYCLENYMV